MGGAERAVLCKKFFCGEEARDRLCSRKKDRGLGGEIFAERRKILRRGNTKTADAEKILASVKKSFRVSEGKKQRRLPRVLHTVNR